MKTDTTSIELIRKQLRIRAQETAWPPSTQGKKSAAEEAFEKFVKACEQLIVDFERSGGECYCDNVQCAYHMAKEAVQ